MQEPPLAGRQRPRGLGLVRLVWNTPGTRLHLLSLGLVITGAILALTDDSWTPALISLAGIVLGFIGYLRQRRHFEQQRRLDLP